MDNVQKAQVLQVRTSSVGEAAATSNSPGCDGGRCLECRGTGPSPTRVLTFDSHGDLTVRS